MSLSDGKTRKYVNAARGGQKFHAHAGSENFPLEKGLRRLRGDGTGAPLGRKLGFDMQNLGWEVTGGTPGGESVSKAEGDMFWDGRCPR